MTSGNFITKNCYHYTASRPAGGVFIMFGLVCDRLGSPSDLVKSWGGGGVDGHMQGNSAGLGVWATV